VVVGSTSETEKTESHGFVFWRVLLACRNIPATRDGKIQPEDWSNLSLACLSCKKHPGFGLNEMTDRVMFHFLFEMTADDDQIFRRIAFKRLLPFLDRRVTKGIPLAVYFSLLVPLFLAYANDVLAASALFTALGAFVLAYLAIWLSSLMGWARLYKAQFSQVAAASKRWDIVFDDDRIVVQHGLTETRMHWAAIARVEDVGSMVIFWYRPGVGYFLPSRAFASDQARTGFAAWAAARAQAAAVGSVAP
jgi:hypothetical protein